MVDYRKLKELVKLMAENDLSELDLRDQQETVVIKRAVPVAAPGYAPAPLAGHYAPPMGHHAVNASPATAQPPAEAEDDESDLVAITSPMVGTFYAAPDPETPAFVSVGSSVGSETVVCIVEAMKVFSEIKAECSGKVEKILVKNGEAVEYGQKLFLVRPS